MRHLIHHKFLSMLILASGIFCSCTDDALYMKTHTFEDNQWNKNEKPIFKVNFPGDELIYDVIFTLRSTTNYKYDNIWLYITTTGPECTKEGNKKSVLGKVPVEIKMAKPNGEWIGEKTGTYVETQLLFRERKFCKGEYTFTIEQGVTMDVMPEVSDITIEVKPKDSE